MHKNSFPQNFSEKCVRKAKVFNSLWESLWKASKIKGFLRVFHRENSLFLWKTFLISLGNDCGNCLNREKQQNRKRILTAKNAAFHANRSHPAEPYREISVGWPGGKKSDTLSLPHNPGVVSCTEGRNVSATIVYVMAAHLFTEWPVQNSRALARCVGIIAAATAPITPTIAKATVRFSPEYVPLIKETVAGNINAPAIPSMSDHPINNIVELVLTDAVNVPIP